DVDGEIARLVVNGVDVTTYVNERDEWFDLRSRVRPTDVDSIRDGTPVFVAAWEAAIQRARALPREQQHASVDGEWSFVQTLRHLVFATDKWFTVPVGGGGFHATGLPNTGSADFGWDGLDPAAAPSLDDAIGVWRDRWDRLQHDVAGLDPAGLDVEVEVLENGTTAVHDCIGVVFEEHFEHLRYATRDLARLE
ncbi:MAG: DinB family protein, partial [Ilumatobacteraceae bacterium]